MSFEISAPVPTAKNNATRRRQLRAAERMVAAFQHLLDEAAPEDLEGFSDRVERALEPLEVGEEKRDLVARITGDRTHDAPSERASLEAAALARSFARRREVLAGALSAPEVAEILGTSRQTPHDRARAGTLLGVLERGALRFPAWQFDPAGEGGVVGGLAEVLGALRASPFGKAYWLSRPNPYLGDRTPVDMLKEGEVEAVKRLAEAVGAA